jgi:hypothetical protein
MRKSAGLVAALLVVLASQSAHARAPRGGNVMGPDGIMYNTRSPEWRASGGNVYAYQQILMQKQMMAQQQQALRQQQAFAKQQQQLAKKNGTNKNQAPTPPITAPVIASKKKKRTYDPSHPVGAQP